MTGPVEIPTPTSPSTDECAGLLTWNVQHAAPDRAARQIAWLAAQRCADVVVLTELPRLGSAHADGLRAFGYSVIDPPPNGDYRTLIASRGSAVEVNPGYDGRFSGRLVAAQVSVGKFDAKVVGLYVPSRGGPDGRNVAKRAFQSEVIAWLADQQPNGVRLLVAGDLNVVEPNHRPHHAVFGLWEYDFYRSFEGAGLTDLFRASAPDTIDHSWFGRSGMGYRFDHIFGSSSVASDLVDCHYDQTPRASGLSDHAAMIARLACRAA